MGSRSVHLKLLASAFFWGGAAIAGKIALEEGSPALVTFLRFFGAVVVLVVLMLVAGNKLRGSLGDHVRNAILGLVGVTACYYCYFRGLDASTAFNAGLVEATIPLATLFFAVAVRKERFNMARGAGFLLAYLGVILVLMGQDLSNLTALKFSAGDALLLLSTVAFGLYNVLVKSFSTRQSDSVRTMWIFAYGTIGLVPWLLWSTPSGSIPLESVQDMSAIAIGATVFLAVGASVLAYVFFNQGVRELGASRASSFINLVPVITTMLAIVLLGERPRILQFVGALMVLAGVYVAQGKREA